MKNSNKLYAILITAMGTMLVAGVVLAWVFFDNLLQDASTQPSAPDSSSQILPDVVSSDLAKEQQVAIARLVSSPRKPVRGEASGYERKFQPKIPDTKPTEGTTPPHQDPSQPTGKDEAINAFNNMPLTFNEDCRHENGCSEFDFSAAGAGFNIQINPGRICLQMKRPEVNVPQGTNITYHPSNSGSINACELESEVNVCFDMIGSKLSPGNSTGSGAANQSSGSNGDDPNAAYTADNFQRWHEDLLGKNDIAKERIAPDYKNQSLNTTVNKTTDFTSATATSLMPGIAGGSSVEYPDIYEGIDLTCYGNQSHMEFVYVLWPGANPQDISFVANGVNKSSLDSTGNLVMDLTGGKLVQHAPRAYQIIDGVPSPIDINYLMDGDAIGFDVPEYDKQKPLIISPKLDYASYLGGTGFDRAYSIAIDNNGFAYVAGATISPIFGATDPDMPKQRNNVDIFVSKFRIADSKPIYTSFIGGESTDRAFAVSADYAGNVYVCGETLSQDFPVTNSNEKPIINDSWNGFLTILGPEGTNIIYSSTFGGSDDDRFYSMAIDSSTNIYLAGETSSGDIPIQNGFQQRHRGNTWDAFIVRLNHDDFSTDYSTYFGGSGNDTINAIAIDYNQNLIIAGETSSADMGVVNALSPQFNGGSWDGFVARLPHGGNGVGFMTYIGGNNDDRVNGVSVDAAGNIYLAGETSSGNFQTSSNAIQKAYGGGDSDAFIVKLLPNGSKAVYSSYFGGNGDDRGFAIDSDSTGNSFLAGATTSDNLPTVDPLQGTYSGGGDGFVARFSPSGTALTFASYYGGDSSDAIYSVTVDGARSAHFAGTTSSTNLPTSKAPQGDYSGGQTDSMFGRILPASRPGPDMKIVPGGGQPNGPNHDFYMSDTEVNNDEYVRFLNDAQANTNNARGANMYFDKLGNVWFNPAMDEESHEMFIAYRSRIKYNEKFQIGERYSVTPKVPEVGESYSNHPVINVSWYGTLKYCNWITIDAGRGKNERCFNEGTNSWDWRPVTCAVTNWIRGDFKDTERQAWLKYKGYRIPMDNSEEPPEVSAGDFAVSNEQFVRFLNNVQVNISNERGANMFFDSVGSIWFNPAKYNDEDMLFSIYDSRLIYDPTKQAGTRFSVTTVTAYNNMSFTKFPVKGVTDRGKAKFCNWFTLDEGGSLDDRSYTEGTQFNDWAPSTVSKDEWSTGTFTMQAQDDWEKLPGAKLPINIITNANDWIFAALLDYQATNSWVNPYNEFYKSSAWNGKTNMSYSFGRDILTGSDANFLDGSGQPVYDTTPTGFHDGTDRSNVLYRTQASANHYGIHDASGNISEWLVDPGKRSSLKSRACYGGSWIFTALAAGQRFHVPPYFSNGFRGFRMASTESNQNMFMIRIPYKICLCARGVGAGCQREDIITGEDEEEEYNVLTTMDPTEGPGGIVPKPEEPVTPDGVPTPRPPEPGPEPGPGPTPPIPPVSPSGL